MTRRAPLALTALLTSSIAFASPPDDDDDPLSSPSMAPSRMAPKMRVQYSFDDAFSAGETLGATPGGAQDIGHARDRITAGEVPHARAFTPEGLFSEHDLPLAGTKCTQLICVGGEAMRSTLLAQPEVRWLAQIGFDTGIDAKSFERDPLNLVAVVDTSGSMSGEPHRLVRESLLAVLDQLAPTDQLTIVLYDSNAHVALPTTKLKNRNAIAQGIAMIQSGGSTAMEEGLKLGFAEAQASKRGFNGVTRVMLFTDERPNVGRTDAGSFMGMARAASRAGVGLTTIGVSTHFGAELAQTISAVRGGNLFFFPNVTKMKAVFEDELDTMVTRFAYDMALVVKPGAHTKIAGVYGVPGDLLTWRKNGAIELTVETLFASKNKGAIYVSFAPDGAANLPQAQIEAGGHVGTVGVSYLTRTGKREKSGAAFALKPKSASSLGLVRGSLLVDQATAMKKAATLHHENNDQEAAYRIIHALATRYRHSTDTDLAGERTTVFALLDTLARLSGHMGEGDSGALMRDDVTGLPPRTASAP